MQGSGSIFCPTERCAQKISTLTSLHEEILAVLDYRQADIPKTRNLGNRLARAIVPPKPPVLPFIMFLFGLMNLRMWGLPPPPLASLHPKTRS